MFALWSSRKPPGESIVKSVEFSFAIEPWKPQFFVFDKFLQVLLGRTMMARRLFIYSRTKIMSPFTSRRVAAFRGKLKENQPGYFLSSIRASFNKWTTIPKETKTATDLKTQT